MSPRIACLAAILLVILVLTVTSPTAVNGSRLLQRKARGAVVGGGKVELGMPFRSILDAEEDARVTQNGFGAHLMRRILQNPLPFVNEEVTRRVSLLSQRVCLCACGSTSSVRLCVFFSSACCLIPLSGFSVVSRGWKEEMLVGGCG